MLSLMILVVFGLIIGSIVKIIHPGDEPVGYIPTVAIGIAGSFVGGFMNYILGFSHHFLAPSGFLMSILGGICCCIAWRWYSLKISAIEPKSFFTGKKIR